MIATLNELRTTMLDLATRSAEDPASRAVTARWLRATLALMDAAEPLASFRVRPQSAFALREMAEYLSLAAEHASWLARDVEDIRPPPVRAE